MSGLYLGAGVRAREGALLFTELLDLLPAVVVVVVAAEGVWFAEPEFAVVLPNDELPDELELLLAEEEEVSVAEFGA